MGSRAVSSRELVTAFLGRRAGRRLARKGAAYLAPECVIDWPCSGERIVGRSEFANVQARYPTEGSAANCGRTPRPWIRLAAIALSVL